MKTKHKPYLGFYLRNIEKKTLIDESGDECSGLCDGLGGWLMENSMVDLFEPTSLDYTNYNIHAYEDGSGFWGSGTNEDQRGKFTELRQTIVLFLAAMNDEL
jgi:hypothetical protein